MIIKSVKIIDSESKHNNKIRDIRIEKGVIVKIAANIPPSNNKIFQYNNLHVSPGWFDMHVNFRDPGFEHKEDIDSGSKAALKGGFTGILLMPQTNPVIDNVTQVEYINSKSKRKIIDVFQSGSISNAMEGKDLVEMYDMKNAGVVAFTDDKKSLQNNQLMKLALLYSQDFNGLIMNFPHDCSIAVNGQINEGKMSTLLGLKGIPNITEEIMLDRDISLCKYTEGNMHLSYISTKNSVNKIRQGKKKGLNLSADVTLHNLFLTDDQIIDFDTRFKVLPPLRSKQDCNALIKGLKDGTIDVICTDHSPEDRENKKIEFNQAAFGIIGLESAFGLIIKYLEKHLDLHEIIEKIAINPRKILSLPSTTIKEGNLANLTFFDPSMKWTFNKNDIYSKSENTPFIGEKLKGKALAIYNKGKFQKI